MDRDLSATEELAWSAGFVDGDGTFSAAAGYAMLSIGGTDLSLLERFQTAVGTGSIIGPYSRQHPKRFSRQPQYFLQTYRDTRIVAELLWPFLGAAKRAQVARLERSHTWRNKPPVSSAEALRAPLSQRPRLRLAWAAGFFDAEGCFSFSPKSGICASITNTDLGQLKRIQRATGFGKIYGPYQSKITDGFQRKPHYFYRVSGLEKVQALAALLWFKIGSAKKEQVRATLAHISATCRRGHPKKPGHTGCGQCMADYWRARREARGNGSTAEPATLYLTA